SWRPAPKWPVWPNQSTPTRSNVSSANNPCATTGTVHRIQVKLPSDGGAHDHNDNTASIATLTHQGDNMSGNPHAPGRRRAIAAVIAATLMPLSALAQNTAAPITLV